MKLLESYSLQSGQLIRKPFLLSKFFPLSVDKFITIHPYSKPSKNYDNWVSVLELLAKPLNDAKISIVQIGGKDELPLPGTVNLAGQTNIGQIKFILEHSLLHLGCDSFPTHIAGSLDKKIVALYSNNFISCVKPYWGNPNNQILLEPSNRPNGNKPSFQLEEKEKFINSIKPEVVAQSVLDLLDIPYKIQLETVLFGQYYNNRVIEGVPNQIVNINELGIDSLIMRMDYEYNVENLEKQLQVSKCSIVTRQEIPIELLLNLRQNISEMLYIIDEFSNSEFPKQLIRNGIKCNLVSEMPDEKIQAIKPEYMDIGVIHKKRYNKPKELLQDNLFFKSNKVIISNGKIYPSRYHWKKDKPIPNFIPTILPVEYNDEFFKEVDYFYFFKLNNQINNQIN